MACTNEKALDVSAFSKNTFAMSDHLSNEVAISAKLEESGVAASAKSRAVSAFDRLLGSAVDIPTAYLENISAKARLRGDLERKKLIQAADAGTQEAELDGAEYLAAKSAEDEARKLENIGKIVHQSIEMFSDADASDSAEDELNLDWLNRFRTYAEEVSSETMRGLWARVLAGEISRPNTFSVSTLRFLSEVDQRVAELFQEKAKSVNEGAYIPKPKEMKGQTIWDFGLLEEAGLVRDANGFLGVDKEPDSEGRIFYREKNLLLVIKTTSKTRLDIIPLTNTGKELLGILPQQDPSHALSETFQSLDSAQIKSAKICVILEEVKGGQIRYADLTVLKSENQ